MTFQDPALNQVAQLEREGRMPFIYPQEFIPEYKTLPDGSIRKRLIVMVAKKGQQNPNVTPYYWDRLERNPSDPIYQVLKPYYDNYIKGQTTPTNGLPLEAWLADAGLVKVLNSVNIRSVEDLAAMEDSAIQRLNVPGLRDKQKNAKAFIETRRSTAPIAAQNAKMAEDIEHMKRENAELRALIEQYAIQQDAPAEVRRGPGRPRKNPPPEPEAA